MTATPELLERAFEDAKEQFRESLKDPKQYQDLLKTQSIDDLWKLVGEVQARQDAQKILRNMDKIGGFLEKLKDYFKVVDTFVQVKPDIMAVIWGSIGLVLVWTANAGKFADAVTSAMSKIGDALPHFGEMLKAFEHSERMKQATVGFYCNILNFHVIILEFFSRSCKCLAHICSSYYINFLLII